MAVPPEWVGPRAQSLLAEHQVPGLAVGVCDRNGTRWSFGIGTTAQVGGQPVSSKTMFSLQSASKMYTATAVMCAVRDGLVDLDEPVSTYLPGFTVTSPWEDDPKSRMTLRLLLSHRTGLVHEAPRGSNYDQNDESFEDHCASISETTLLFPVGERYSYSNLGIDLAALVVQRVSGLGFADYVEQLLLQPLGLTRTTFDPAQIEAELDRAQGHAQGGPPPLRVPMIGAGGAYASVTDVLGYVQFHLASGAGLLTPHLLGQMYRVLGAADGVELGYGLGIDTGRRSGRLVRNHGGGGFGFLCDVVWDPAAGVGVVVLTNAEDHPFQITLSTEILDHIAPP